MTISSLIKRNQLSDFVLLDRIKDSYRELISKPPLTEESWLRISGVGNICQREEVLCYLNDIVRDEMLDGDKGMNFEHGHAVHWMFQSRILPFVGVLIGSWRCTYCGEVYGSRDTRMIPRPPRCARCGAIAGEGGRIDGRPDTAQDNAFVYVEEWLGNEELRIGGSPDGQLIQEYDPNYTNDDLILLEFKSCNDRNFIKYKTSPDFVHVIQAHLYMWLCEYKHCKILYFNKNELGTKGMAEHDIEYDQECVDRVLAAIREMREGIVNRCAPARTVCVNIECQRARNCKVKDLCFAGE